MIVKSLEHGKRVFRRLARNPHLMLDTETEPKPPWMNKRDAITWGRQHIRIFSACYMGEHYAFPTSVFSPEYPTPREWFALVKKAIKNTVPVFHNANYDLSVIDTSIDYFSWSRVWDTMIAGWMANPAFDKGLKARATLYGRFLQETKNVDKTDLKAFADYACQDVVVGDEMYQMQHFGFVLRRKKIKHLNRHGKLVTFVNQMPTGKLVIPNESLRPFDKAWLELLELPVLHCTRRAQTVGFPLDQKYLRKIKRQMDADLEQLLKDIYRKAGKKINLNSPKDLEWLFDKLRIHNPHKTRTGKMARGKNILAKLVGSHPIIQKIANRQKIDTLVSFYFGALKKDGTPKEQGLAYFVNPADGRIHAMLSTVGSITGRNSCANPNLMQIPSRADIYSIKKAFVPPGLQSR